jgi:protein-L-isoaspartate(D-aspartate) O-methyltransferase
MRARLLTIAIALLAGAIAVAGNWEAERRAMVESLRQRGIRDARVLSAMRQVPRHLFVPEKEASRAYDEVEIEIGERQVIWRPYLVALTTELGRVRPGDNVLEVGTGSGYHAAVLSLLCRQVYTIEIIPSLARSAQERLKRLRYDRVHVKQGDGYQGWAEHAPFDVIIVTCTADEVPIPLVDQLKEEGRMVIPVSDQGQQTLTLMEKREGKLRTVSVRKVKLSPMQREK